MSKSTDAKEPKIASTPSFPAALALLIKTINPKEKADLISKRVAKPIRRIGEISARYEACLARPLTATLILGNPIFLQMWRDILLQEAGIKIDHLPASPKILIPGPGKTISQAFHR